MKKFFYSLVMMAISMMTFVSCSSDDDDDAVVSQDLVGGVICGFSQDALDFYNIKMTATGANGASCGSYNINSLTPFDTDDNGAKLFAVEFPIKDLPISVKFEATCSKKTSDFNKDQKYSFIYGARGIAGKKKGEGFSKANISGSYFSGAQTGEKWVSIKEGDKTYYEDFARAISSLTANITK